MAIKILNFGSLNYDLVYEVDHIVTPGETLSSNSTSKNTGGKGLNQSISLAKAGMTVFHAGAVGNDGNMLLDELKKNGVDTQYTQVLDAPTGHAIIQVDKNGQNCIILFGGANLMQTKQHIDNVFESFDKGDYIILQNEINSMPYIIDKAFEKEMFIILNPSPYNENMEKCDLNKVSLFLINEVEGEQITGEKEPDKILDKMMELYPSAKVVLTLGAQGSVYCDTTQRISQEAFRVKAVDTTAAGDTFTGYFVAFMNNGIKNALEIASKASSIAVSREGAAQSIPMRSEVIND